ncbi:10406_t:CDS:2 [Paraglomus brasilianum]|uniref:10406_t:CDS:1 n=1 Tax=Paraglomus brasilianum TaxID=144538 RepID=A0A9N9F3N8_9GLOM|nr:10406_t:CDS:2 [Paraglomus brasilianum]
MSVGSVCPLIDDLLFIKGTPTVLGEVPQAGGKRIYVVEFWATWCWPCRESIPHLSGLGEKYKGHGVTVVGVTREKDHDKVKQFVAEMGDKMSYNVAIDVNLTAREALYTPSNAPGIPKAFVLLNNVVFWHGHPVDDDIEAEIIKAIESN